MEWTAVNLMKTERFLDLSKGQDIAGVEDQHQHPI